MNIDTPLDEHALDFFDDDAKRLVKEMLQAVTEHPNIYSNGFRVARSKTGDSFEYFLSNHGAPGPFRNNQRLQTNIIDTLVFHRIAGPRINPNWPQEFRSFTDAALGWYRTYGRISPDDIRKAIGQLLRQQTRGSQGRFVRFDAEAVAEAIGTTPELVSEHFQTLCDVGLIERRPIGDGEYGVLGLSKPNGVLWAERGYPPIQTLGNQTITVMIDLHVEIHNIIEQARATEVSEELKREFEALLRRAEEELEKPAGQGRFQRIKDLVDFAADVKEFVPLVGRLAAEHGDKIQQMTDAAM